MVDIVLSVYLFSIVIGIFGSIWGRLGGWPEAYWRIVRKRYFVQHIFGTDGQDYRIPHLWKKIDHHSPAGFSYNGKRYLTTEEDMGHDTGRSAWWYNYNETRPVPIFRWRKGVEWNAGLIGAAYENRSISDMHRLGQRRISGAVLVIIVLVVIVAIIAGASLYYNYNNFCALDPSRCAGGRFG